MSDARELILDFPGALGALHDVVRAEWEAWTAQAPRNARLRRIAEAMSDIVPEHLNTVVYATPASSLAVCGARPVVSGQMVVAWAMHLQQAEKALRAMELMGIVTP